MTYENLHELLLCRQSVRYFSEEAISEEQLINILQAGRLAPSVENVQPWHFHVIKNAEKKAQMMSASCYGNFVSGASVFVVITCKKDMAAKSPETLWNPVEIEYSCVAAIQCMMLAAASMNIGSCWVSLHHGAAHDILHLQDHQAIIGGMMLGKKKKEREEGTTHEHLREPLETMYTVYE